MCGIAGVLGDSSFFNVDAAVDALTKRGPDSHGNFCDDKVVLVHTRLSVLGLGAAGGQPMLLTDAGNIRNDCCHDGGQLSDSPSHAIAFNGEIYNFYNLRQDLSKCGVSFSGQSDTEVLLHLLKKDGVGSLQHLLGMFAFCFWDQTTGEAILARDAHGIKPLYYRVDDGVVTFASDSRLLQRASDEVDSEALRDFLLWGSVVEPATLHKTIRQVPAGHYLKWKDGSVSVQRWYIPPKVTPAARVKQAGWILFARDALLESVQRHLVSDVPVGVFLSGGIDSTAILALTREVLGQNADIRTFSIGFNEAGFDESALAQRTADHFDCDHTLWRMTAKDGLEEIPAFLEAMDLPSTDGFNTWCVSRLAKREGMKVVLSGVGGDEVFAGYPSFNRVPALFSFYHRLGPLRSIVAFGLKQMPVGSKWRRLAAFLCGKGSWLEAFHAFRGVFTPDEAVEIVQHWTGNIPSSPFCESIDLPDDPRELVGHLELTRYMRNQLLRDSDVFSMAHGLELRTPLVDTRLIETLSQVPAAVRLQQGKRLLLDAVPEIPGWIREQPKRGFRFPFEQWLTGALGDVLSDARDASPVAFKSWYRTWAVATALRRLPSSCRLPQQADF